MGLKGVKAIDSWKWLVIDLNVLPQQEIVDRFRNCIDLTNKALRVSMTDPPYDDFRLNFDLTVFVSRRNSLASLRSSPNESPFFWSVVQFASLNDHLASVRDGH